MRVGVHKFPTDVKNLGIQLDNSEYHGGEYTKDIKEAVSYMHKTLRISSIKDLVEKENALLIILSTCPTDKDLFNGDVNRAKSRWKNSENVSLDSMLLASILNPELYTPGEYTSIYVPEGEHFRNSSEPAGNDIFTIIITYIEMELQKFENRIDKVIILSTNGFMCDFNIFKSQSMTPDFELTLNLVQKRADIYVIDLMDACLNSTRTTGDIESSQESELNYIIYWAAQCKHKERQNLLQAMIAAYFYANYKSWFKSSYSSQSPLAKRLISRGEGSSSSGSRGIVEVDPDYKRFMIPLSDLLEKKQYVQLRFDAVRKRWKARGKKLREDNFKLNEIMELSITRPLSIAPEYKVGKDSYEIHINSSHYVKVEHEEEIDHFRVSGINIVSIPETLPDVVVRRRSPLRRTTEPSIEERVQLQRDIGTQIVSQLKKQFDDLDTHVGKEKDISFNEFFLGVLYVKSILEIVNNLPNFDDPHEPIHLFINMTTKKKYPEGQSKYHREFAKRTIFAIGNILYDPFITTLEETLDLKHIDMWRDLSSTFALYFMQLYKKEVILHFQFNNRYSRQTMAYYKNLKIFNISYFNIISSQIGYEIDGRNRAIANEKAQYEGFMQNKKESIGEKLNPETGEMLETIKIWRHPHDNAKGLHYIPVFIFIGNDGFIESKLGFIDLETRKRRVTITIDIIFLIPRTEKRMKYRRVFYQLKIPDVITGSSGYVLDRKRITKKYIVPQMISAWNKLIGSNNALNNSNLVVFSTFLRCYNYLYLGKLGKYMIAKNFDRKMLYFCDIIELFTRFPDVKIESLIGRLYDPARVNESGADILLKFYALNIQLMENLFSRVSVPMIKKDVENYQYHQYVDLSVIAENMKRLLDQVWLGFVGLNTAGLLIDEVKIRQIMEHAEMHRLFFLHHLDDFDWQEKKYLARDYIKMDLEKIRKTNKVVKLIYYFLVITQVEAASTRLREYQLRPYYIPMEVLSPVPIFMVSKAYVHYMPELRDTIGLFKISTVMKNGSIIVRANQNAYDIFRSCFKSWKRAENYYRLKIKLADDLTSRIVNRDISTIEIYGHTAVIILSKILECTPIPLEGNYNIVLIDTPKVSLASERLINLSEYFGDLLYEGFITNCSGYLNIKQVVDLRKLGSRLQSLSMDMLKLKRCIVTFPMRTWYKQDRRISNYVLLGTGNNLKTMTINNFDLDATEIITVDEERIRLQREFDEEERLLEQEARDWLTLNRSESLSESIGNISDLSIRQQLREGSSSGVNVSGEEEEDEEEGVERSKLEESLIFTDDEGGDMILTDLISEDEEDVQAQLETSDMALTDVEVEQEGEIDTSNMVLTDVEEGEGESAEEGV